MPSCNIEEIATELFALLATGGQVAPVSARCADFGLAEAYQVAARIEAMRQARGEIPVGQKIGFTNRAAWKGYGISGPIWAPMFDSTVHDLEKIGSTFSLNGYPEARIEPEIVLHLAKAPQPGMDEVEIAGCIDWVAQGFEIVFSVFPDWKFTAADAAAAFGVHGALLLGERHSIDGNRERWLQSLSSFTIELACSNGTKVQGEASNVLGGPVTALQFLVRELAGFPNCKPLRAGDLVTTGTLTQAMSAKPGEQWRTALEGIDMAGIRAELTA